MMIALVTVQFLALVGLAIYCNFQHDERVRLQANLDLERDYIERLQEVSQQTFEAKQDTPPADDAFLELADLRAKLAAAQREITIDNENLATLSEALGVAHRSNAALRGQITKLTKKKR